MVRAKNLTRAFEPSQVLDLSLVSAAASAARVSWLQVSLVSLSWNFASPTNRHFFVFIVFRWRLLFLDFEWSPGNCADLSKHFLPMWEFQGELWKVEKKLKKWASKKCNESEHIFDQDFFVRYVDKFWRIVWICGNSSTGWTAILVT